MNLIWLAMLREKKTSTFLRGGDKLQEEIVQPLVRCPSQWFVPVKMSISGPTQDLRYRFASLCSVTVLPQG